MLNFSNNFPLSKATTLCIGGPAKKFVAVSSPEELIEAVGYAKQNALDYLLIGGGSNLLVSDAGVEKLVIKNSISGISQNNNEISVKSGTILQDLVDYTIKNNLAGIQKMSGIPGTVGGAVYGNAGAYGQSISDYLTQVKAFDGNTVVTLTKEDCKFNYRDSIFKRNHFVVLEIKFSFDEGESQILEEEARNVLAQRAIKYPPGIKCPGSFFKNIVASTLSPEILAKIPPEKIVYGKLPAGVLLEEVGAKGETKGDIEIAPYHANLFINKQSLSSSKSGGSAQDFYDLAKKMSEKVKQKFGITLQPEVQLINLPQF